MFFVPVFSVLQVTKLDIGYQKNCLKGLGKGNDIVWSWILRFNPTFWVLQFKKTNIWGSQSFWQTIFVIISQRVMATWTWPPYLLSKQLISYRLYFLLITKSKLSKKKINTKAVFFGNNVILWAVHVLLFWKNFVCRDGWFQLLIFF